MPIIRKPQKAPTNPVPDIVLRQQMAKFGPVVGSPKLDGFRCLIQHGPKTSSLKLFPNKFLNKELTNPLYEGLDGELVIGNPTDPDVFNRTTGALRRIEGEPDFSYYVFDDFNYPGLFYLERCEHLCTRLGIDAYNPTSGRIILLEAEWLSTFEEVIEYESRCVELGYEGAMVRFPKKSYKFGRTTELEAIIHKRKSFVDAEAVIVGVEEEMLNTNEKFKDAMGHSKRSSHKENKIPKGTLGAFILKSDLWDETFNCGNMKGVTNEMRKNMWDNRDELIGKTVTFKYQPHGTIEKPRLPTLKGKESVELLRFREGFDL